MILILISNPNRRQLRVCPAELPVCRATHKYGATENVKSKFIDVWLDKHSELDKRA